MNGILPLFLGMRVRVTVSNTLTYFLTDWWHSS